MLIIKESRPKQIKIFSPEMTPFYPKYQNVSENIAVVLYDDGLKGDKRNSW